ncbi:MAG: phosphotransferase [Ottowia sp.]|nr:phosphotransferase [Halieaceae bacterium]MCB2069075.1 phosphotransferase [Ottowia sp.]
MNARPPPNDLLPWALGQLALDAGHADSHPQAVAGDASNRRYFRAALGGRSRILVEAPPGTEKNAEFLAVRALLAAAGVRVPALYGSDLQRGYLLLEDLGDRLLLPELTTGSVDAAYRRAMDVLLRMAALETAGLDIPHYDAALLQEELGRFPAWFAEALLGHTPDEQERGLLRQVDSLLVASALEQPQVLVHRDFHSRNLMPQEDGALAVIDFQDAVAGPISYDLVSLLRDCYVRWPAARVRDWALDYRTRLQAAGLLGEVDEERFLRWFDLMGLQRHIKVLGTFARLYLRDGKPGYLADLPRVIDYVLEIADLYAPREPALAAFGQWFRRRLAPLVAARDWGRP